LNINIVDAGARYGIHPSFKAIVNFSKFYLFEPEPFEFKRLTEKYEEYSNIEVSNIALSNQKETLDLRVSEHSALSTLKPIGSYIAEENYKVREFSEVTSVKVETELLDNIFSNKKIDFLKLDVEGFELNVLEGAKFQLENNIVGVRSEVTFADLHGNGPSFCEINKYLLDNNFELLNFDYNGGGFASSIITHPNKFGKLISTDGVWIKKIKYLNNQETVIEKTLKIVIFCLLNGATDVAVFLLLELSKTQNILSYSSHVSEIKFIKQYLAILCKELSYNPNVDYQKILQIWASIFSDDFPQLSDFWVVFGEENAEEF
jgi:FkbM family methyltransferase